MTIFLANVHMYGDFSIEEKNHSNNVITVLV